MVYGKNVSIGWLLMFIMLRCTEERDQKSKIRHQHIWMSKPACESKVYKREGG